ncbi:GNAT family N-acetyltransferase [Flexivirga sp.]|uniref:GNAT family N-acetyltransferase n=1 Tax=Flexivirga sp. TaxID=1962927 RepID=UPI003F81C2D2
MTAHWPFDELALNGPELLLRPVRDADLTHFIAIFPDDFDLDPRFPPLIGLPAQQDRERQLAQSVWRHRGCWSIDEWALDFGVWRNGEPVGIQTLEGTRFSTDRRVDTASWIAKPVRGNGFGIHAREAVLAFAFGHLGARQAITSAVVTNQASLGVSRHLGYRDDGIRPHDSGDGVVDLQHLTLSRDDWAAGDMRIPFDVNGFDDCRPFFARG